MRAIMQRVSNASVVTMDEMMITAIGAGLLVWVGIRKTDRQADIDYIVNQILNFQIYDKDENTKWSQSVVDKDYEILCLSEVSLYYSTKGSFKPKFHLAMDSDSAKIFFTNFVNELKKWYKPNKVRRGRYGMSSFVNAQFVGPIFSFQSPRLTKLPGVNGSRHSDSGHPNQMHPKQPGPGFSQYLDFRQPTRTIPRGVGKFYGQQDYNWQYQQNQEVYNQPVNEHYQQPYGQNPYGQLPNQVYGQPNVYGQESYVQHPQSQQTYNQAYNQPYNQHTPNQQIHNQQYNQQTPYQQYNQQIPNQQYNPNAPNHYYNRPPSNQQYNQQYQQLRYNQRSYQPPNQHYFQGTQNVNLTNQQTVVRPTSL